MQDRVLDAADILIDRHPGVGDFGIVGSASFFGSVKRTKYQDESTKVSMVSVSRVACPPHCGQDTCLPRRMMVERIAGPIEGHVLRQRHRQIFFRHRHDAAVRRNE